MLPGSAVLGVVVLVVCVAAAAALRKKQGVHVSADGPVYARPVMSEVERKLFHRLIEAFPEKFVLPQVQLCRFVEVRNVPGRTAVLNRYSRLSADFIICTADAAVERVVELDDNSHNNEAARYRDAKKDAVLKAAGIPIIRLQAKAIPSIGNLQRLVFADQYMEGLREAQLRGSRIEPTICCRKP